MVEKTSANRSEWGERRRETRRPEHRAISVLFQINFSGTTVERPAAVAVLDSSPWGLGLAYSGLVSVGSRVAILLGQNGRPAAWGTVRSCVPIARPLHRIGVELDRFAAIQVESADYSDATI